MTTVATPVISVRFDERPREWRSYVHAIAVDELVDAIVTEPPEDAAAYVHGHREIHLGDRPYDPLHAALAPMMLVVVGGGCGAAYFRDLDADGRALGFIARGDERLTNPPQLALNAQGSIHFDDGDVLSRERLRPIVRAYLVDGERPSLVAWRESDWVL